VDDNSEERVTMFKSSPPAQGTEPREQPDYEEQCAKKDRIDKLRDHRADQSGQPAAKCGAAAMSQRRREHSERGQKQVNKQPECRAKKAQRNETDGGEHPRDADRDE
jgi:hypothetical protein